MKELIDERVNAEQVLTTEGLAEVEGKQKLMDEVQKKEEKLLTE